MIAVGLVSGTSLDGIDAALVRIAPNGDTYAMQTLGFETVPYAAHLADRLRSVLPPHRSSVEEVARLHKDVGSAFAAAAADVAKEWHVDFVASHGQTIYHAGENAVTLQIGDAFTIRERLRATVIYDFRSADCAAGGQGAPLVPYLDALVLGSQEEDRVAVNIGGIANLSFLPAAGGPQSVIAFDSGPGNMLIDLFVRQRTSGVEQYDKNGAHAARGIADSALLAAMLADAYFYAPIPKSTGHERFGTTFLEKHATALHDLTLQDGAATLTDLTVFSLGDAIEKVSPPGSHVLVSGGGAHNAHLMRRLRERLDRYPIQSSQSMDLCVDAKEALAFVVLGYEALRGRAVGLPRVTGAAHAALLGAIAPHDLASLLQKVERECRQ